MREMLKRLRKSARPSVEQDLYRALVARSREKMFYQEWRVPDTIDGRFDLLSLHAFLIFEALRRQGSIAETLGSNLADVIFTGFDEALRELGISDFGMGRRIRNMADAFYGRLHHYGLARTQPELAAAVQRNLYRGHSNRDREAAGMASYMIMAQDWLKRDLPAVLAGKPDFGPMPRAIGLMMSGSLPFSSFYDLTNLPERGAELTIAPGAKERTRIAAWLNIDSLGGLKAAVKLTRAESGRFLYCAHFDADVVQACVVTLEPVPSHLSADFERCYQLAPSTLRASRKRNVPPEAALNQEDVDAPEFVSSPVIDIASPVLEELSLALDPYPRQEGVAFVQPEPTESARNNPFAILKALKRS